MAAAVVTAVTLYLVGALAQALWNWPGPVTMLFIAVLLKLGRLVSPAWLEVGRFLGPSIEELHTQEPDLPALWRGAGIGEVTQRRLSFGAGLVMSGVRNGDGP